MDIVYLCRAFDQPVRGGAYLDIKETIHISILAFTLFPDYPEFYARLTKILLEEKQYEELEKAADNEKYPYIFGRT